MVPASVFVVKFIFRIVRVFWMNIMWTGLYFKFHMGKDRLYIKFYRVKFFCDVQILKFICMMWIYENIFMCRINSNKYLLFYKENLLFICRDHLNFSINSNYCFNTFWESSCLNKFYRSANCTEFFG